MRDVPLLTAISVSAGTLLFALTWGLTRKRAWLTKAICAGAGWLLLAVVEGGYWAFNGIDFYNPMPCTPWLIALYTMYAALWVAVGVASLWRAPRVLRVVAGVLLSLGLVAAAQWPYESSMSYHCEYHLENQRLALQHYADDHGGKLPSAPGTGWARLTKPYYTYRPDLLKCPADSGKCDTSYSLTPQAAGRSLNKLGDKTILLMENKPRHRGKAHALLASWEVVGIQPKSVPHGH